MVHEISKLNKMHILTIDVGHARSTKLVLKPHWSMHAHTVAIFSAICLVNHLQKPKYDQKSTFYAEKNKILSPLLFLQL